MTIAGRLRWLWLVAAIVVADRATKLAIELYTPETFRRALIPGVAYLVHNRNPGIAFGLFADAGSKWLPILLAATSLLVIVVLGLLLTSGRIGSRLAQIGLALILGGALGNLIDRLLRGSVTDFLEVWLGSYRWPAFNVADSTISLGAVLVVLDLLLGHRHPIKENS
jgi:signal peptidase II